MNKLPKRYAFFLAEGEINAKEDLDFEDVPKSPIMGYKKIGKGISLYSWAAATVPHTLFELFGKGEVVLISPSAEGKFARKFIKDFWPLTMVPKWLED